MTDPIRILYVDDDSHSLELRSSLLEQEGDFDVVTESKAADALKRLDAGEPIDCLLSDLEMPGMDGVEFLQRVRERNAEIPFIMFTAKDTDEAIGTALDSGATDFIPKSTASLSYRLLAQRIKQAVELADEKDRSRDDQADSTRNVASSLEGAMAGEFADDASADQAGNSEKHRSTCPIPGCAFVGETQSDLSRHFADYANSDDLDARMHRALQDQALHGRTSTRTSGKRDDGWIGSQGGPPSKRGSGSGRRSDPANRGGPRGGSHHPQMGYDHQSGVITAAGTGARTKRTGATDAHHSSRPANRQEREKTDDESVRLNTQEIEAVARTVIDHLRDELDLHESVVGSPSPQKRAEKEQEDVDAVSPSSSRRQRSSLSGHRDSSGSGEEDDSHSLEFTFDFEPKGRTPDEESTHTPDLDREAIPDVDPRPGEAILFACDTHDVSREHLCDRGLSINDPGDHDLLLIRYRAIDDDRLERLVTAANRVTLIAVGYEQSIPSQLSDRIELKNIPKVGDLRRLGIMVTRTIEGWKSDETDIRVCIDSLNVILRYADAERVFRFLHLLLGKLESVDGITHGHIDPSSEAPRDINMLETLFDTVVTADRHKQLSSSE